MIDIERDIRLAKAGKGDLVYKTLVGLKSDLSKPASVPEILSKKDKGSKTSGNKEKSGESEDESESDEESDVSSYEGTDEEGSEDESGSEKESKFINSARPKHETAEERKVYNLKTFLFSQR